MNTATKNKFKDWFIITRIRILNFIKEHKYVSALIGVFLMSTIIAIVVKATDTEISSTKVSVTGENRGIVSVTTESESDDKTLAPNFSNVIYALSYSLGEGDATCNNIEDKSSYKVDEVDIEATIPLNDNIRWVGGDETTISEITKDDKNSTLKLTIPMVNVCSSHTQTFTLQVLNAEKDTKIKPTIKIKGGSGGSYETVPDSNTFPEIKTSYDTEKILKPVVRPGVARKADNGRDVMFGIILGIDSDSNNDSVSLKNTHLNTSADVTLIATQGSNESIELYTSNTNKFDNNEHDGNYYGINSSSRYFFTSGNMPDLTATSGKINSLVKLNSNEVTYGVDNSEVVAPVVTLTGPSTVEIEKYPTLSTEKYKNDAKISVNGSSEAEYTEKIYKDDSKESVNEIPLNQIGNYTINYEVNGDNGSKTTIIKTIKIVEPSDNTYSLEGEKTIYVKKGSALVEQGVYKHNGNGNLKLDSSKYSISYLKEEEQSNGLTKDNITQTSGTYTQTYTINPEETEPSTGEPVVLKRTIKVVDNLPSISSEKISVKTGNVYTGETFNNHKILINDEEKDCSNSNNCSSKQNNEQNSFTYTIDKSKDKNYITEITKTVNVIPTQYKLSISGIKPNFTAKRFDNNFYGIGSYYVTVKSTRNVETNDKFDVNLKAILNGSENTNKVENKAFASGEDTSSVTNKMYVTENSELVEVTSDSKNNLMGDYFTASMAEEVLLTSTFEYGYDADENMGELTAKIPVNGNLIPIAYNSEITDDSSSYFGYEITYNGQKINEIPGYEIKYYDSSDREITKETFNPDEQTVSYITIKMTSNDDKAFTIKPGTVIKLITKYKVKTFSGASDVANNLNDLKFNGGATFSWSLNGQTYTIGSDKDTPNVYITPYKVRTTVGIGTEDNYNTNKDIILDASKNENYTVYASLDVTSPAMNVNSNIFGYSRISKLPVIFELPSGVNYVYNKDYTLEPSISYKNGSTILTYNYDSVEPNSWTEPIYFDFNVDVSTVTGNFQIKVSTGDVSNNNFTINNDVSSIDKYKVINKNINIVNVEKVSYGQYVYDNSGKYISNIDKEDSFMFVTKLHNNTNEDITNLTVYTVPPYADTEKSSSFNGTYEIENLPEDAMCAPKEYASFVTKSDLLNQLETIWQPCSNYKNGNRYSEIGAFKVHYDSLTAQKDAETKIKIYTIGNKPDDIYTFKSYLQYNGTDYISFEDVNLEVTSKKITGVVWEDFNVDGIMDDSEKKISNVTLKLYNSSNELIQTTTPDENGRYIFSGVLTGDYYIVADFNTDKYGVTGFPSEDFYDKTRISVFKSVPVTNEEQNEILDETEEIQEKTEQMSIVKTDLINVGSETRVIRNINLGLSLRKIFGVKVNKYISKVDVTNALGVVTTRDYGNTKLAKLDVKDINNLHIKVIYTLEIENVKYYPGYATLITELVPDGMSFNPEYSENKGWELSEDGVLTNTTLANEIINEGEKKYLTIAFDITRKEAGSFINFASVDELQILGGISDEK